MITRDIIISNINWLINSQIAIDIISIELPEILNYLKLIILYLRKYMIEEDKLYDKIFDKFENLDIIILNNKHSDYYKFTKNDIYLINKYFNNDKSNYEINDLPLLQLEVVKKLYNLFYTISINKLNRNTYLPILIGLNIVYQLHPSNVIVE
jgi:hypothetical protein